MNDLEKEKNFVSAVVYLHNDESRAEAFLQMLIAVLSENFLQAEIICVDDGSQDKTRDIVRQTASATQGVSISLLPLASFHGVEAAMTAGVELSIGDFVFEFDGATMDFSAETVMQVYRKALNGFDIVTAVPEGKRAFSSRLFYFCFKQFARDSFQSLDTERFYLLSRRALNRVASMSKRVLYRKVAYLACGLPETSISYKPREVLTPARSKQEKRYRQRLAIDALLLFTDVGYRLGAACTLFMMLFTVIFACYAVVTYLLSSPVAGWTTTVCFLAFAFFALFGLLTLVIKYLQLILSLVFKRGGASFEAIEKLTK